MISEKEIFRILERKIKLYVKTGEDKFLYQIETLQDVLELNNQDIDKMVKTCEGD